MTNSEKIEALFERLKRRNSRKYQKATSRLCWPQEAAVSRRPCEPAANCPTGTISILRVEEPLVTE